jgi:Na+-driven multidrug efflux pump
MRIYLFVIFCADFRWCLQLYSGYRPAPEGVAAVHAAAVLLLIPLLLILPLFWGLDGILYAGPIADLSSGVIVALFILPEMRKLDRQVQEEDARAAASGR